MKVKVLREKFTDPSGDNIFDPKVIEWLNKYDPEVRINLNMVPDSHSSRMIPMGRYVEITFTKPEAALLFKITFGGA